MQHLCTNIDLKYQKGWHFVKRPTYILNRNVLQHSKDKENNLVEENREGATRQSPELSLSTAMPCQSVPVALVMNHTQTPPLYLDISKLTINTIDCEKALSSEGL